FGAGSRSSGSPVRGARGGAVVPSRARSAGADRERPERSGDRRAAVPEPSHGAPSRREHPPQARARFANGGGGGGSTPRPALRQITRTGHLVQMAGTSDVLQRGVPHRGR